MRVYNQAGKVVLENVTADRAVDEAIRFGGYSEHFVSLAYIESLRSLELSKQRIERKRASFEGRAG